MQECRGSGESGKEATWAFAKLQLKTPALCYIVVSPILCLTSSGNLGVINRLNQNFVMDEWYKHVCLIHLKGALAGSFLQTLPNYSFFFTS